MIAPPPHCDECGFDALHEGGSDVPGAVRSMAARFQAPLAMGEPAVRRRPDDKTWSPLEYGAHVRDVIAIWTWTLKQALTVDRPRFPAPDADVADRAADEAGYATMDPPVVAEELVANGERAATKFSSVPPDGWRRVVVLGDEELTVLDIANKILHEGHHHLNDIDRMH